MPLGRILRILLNNEQLVQKLADSYPIRRAAKLTAFFMQRGNEKIEEIKESDSLNKLKDDFYKTEKDLEDRVTRAKGTFFDELNKEWAKEKGKIDAERKRDSEK